MNFPLVALFGKFYIVVVVVTLEERTILEGLVEKIGVLQDVNTDGA